MSNYFLDSNNDLSRIAYNNNNKDIPLKNNTIQDRFDTNHYLNHKETFENTNSRINSLNDEIRELKYKLKIIPEKDEIINSLKNDIQELNSKIESLNDFKFKYHQLLNDNTSLKQEYELIKVDIHKYKKEIESLNSNIKKYEKYMIQNNETNETNETNEINEINNDDEIININIDQIKNILYKRLKPYHEKHIDDLINSYHLNDKSDINKNMIKKLIIQAINI